MFLTYIETRLVAMKLAHTEDGIFDIKKKQILKRVRLFALFA